MADYDVIVVGAGMVGLSMANLLVDQNLTVAVFDRHSPPVEPTAEDLLRVSAISRASENILRALECWQEEFLTRACAYETMHVWDAVGNGEIRFDAAAIGHANLGHIIPNVDIQRALWQKLSDHNKATLITGVQLASADWQSEHVQLNLSNGSGYTARLAIAADGANSWLRKQAGISLHSKAYDHTALVATIATEKQHDNCARQVFLETGPLAFLPTHNKHECSIVWSTAASEVESLLALPEVSFNETLAEAFGDTLGALNLCSERLSFPLVGRHAEHYIKPRLALIGDAAHTIHPLAGQGANLGILDAASLAEVLAECEARGADFDSLPNLRVYERWRRSENQLMLDTMRGFRELFSGPAGVKSVLRSFGMSQLNRLPVLKKPLIETAMGMRGDLPTIARTPMPEI